MTFERPSGQTYARDGNNESYGFRRLLRAVKYKVSVADIAGRATTPRPYGGEAWFIASCPLPDHEDPDPSFYIYPAHGYPGGRWHCYGCGERGDVLDLYLRLGSYGGDRKAALVDLAGEHGVEVPRPESFFRKNKRQRRVRDKLEEARLFCARRHLYRIFFKPWVEAVEDPEDRAHDAQVYWEITALLASELLKSKREDGA